MVCFLIYYNSVLICGDLMLKKWFLMAAVFLILFNISCKKSDSLLKDGYYTAQAAQYDGDGWREYLIIRISDGKIIHVEYNAINESGFLKTWDMDYMRDMNAASGTYPSAYSRIYGEELLKKQSMDGINCISGATHSYHRFIMLAEAVLESARNGNSGIRFVELPEFESSYREQDFKKAGVN